MPLYVTCNELLVYTKLRDVVHCKPRNCNINSMCSSQLRYCLNSPFCSNTTIKTSAALLHCNINDSLHWLTVIQSHVTSEYIHDSHSCSLCDTYTSLGWLGSRVVSVLDSGAEGPGFKSQSRRCCLRQTVHTHCASVQQAAKLVAALLRVAGVTAGLAESNGSLLPGLWLTSPAGWLPRTGISSGTLRSVFEYGLPFYTSL